MKTTNDDYLSTSNWYDRLLNPFLSHIRKSLVNWVVVNKPKRILDVGCGTGKQLSLLPNNIDAVGIDISDAMLAQANIQAAGKCKKGDAIDIPFEDNEFDLVISQFALHEKDTDIINLELSEIRRILKPSGLFSVTDFDIPVKATLISKIFGSGIHQVEKHAGDEHYKNYLTWMNRGGLEKIMLNSGWKLVEDIPFYKGNVRLTFWSIQN
jgi:ubiquinone/menaquinone biosynthesis C-methylase UbiE